MNFESFGVVHATITPESGGERNENLQPIRSIDRRRRGEASVSIPAPAPAAQSHLLKE